MPAKLANEKNNNRKIQLNDLLACLTPSPEGRKTEHKSGQALLAMQNPMASHGTQLMWDTLSCVRIRKLYQTLQGTLLASPSPSVSLFPPIPAFRTSGAKASQISGPRPRSLGICDPMADKHRQASKTSISTSHAAISPRNPTAHLLHLPGFQPPGYYEAL